ncbi:MAG: pyridoxamine 5'-phosphate oxidase family protein [Salinivirgaceae bacterium]|nr:pyridoxamine 5'-phosphate oxidase family protein [Salinivirgaceae bacterium]
MRRKDREVTDITDILRIVHEAKILHLALFDTGYPYIVPLHYGYEVLDGKLVFYMHSAKEGYKLDLIKKDQRACVELECNVDLISGGESPCRYGSAYASVIAKGIASIVDDEQEKIHGLGLLMENQTDRHFTIDGNMAKSVVVIKVVSDSFTAKAKQTQ